VAASPSGKAPQSFSDALGDVLMAVANAKLCPDADLGFLNKVEMVVLGRLKHPDQAPGGAQPPGAAGGGGPTPPPPGGPPPAGAKPAAPGQAPPPQGGPAPHPNIPNMDPDEMRRVIAQTTGS
jgi:hypothetical protein